MDMVSATATRRDVFAMSPTGLAAVAASDMTLRIPSPRDRPRVQNCRHYQVRGHARNRIATKHGFARLKRGYTCPVVAFVTCESACRCTIRHCRPSRRKIWVTRSSWRVIVPSVGLLNLIVSRRTT